MPKKECYYADYLNLENVLKHINTCQLNAHDEHLFIITHQNHELWFKQLIFELQSVLDMMQANEGELALAKIIIRLNRCQKIFDTLIRQIDILETMSPMAFLAFRDKIIPASGFQSLQFRLLEHVLGVDAVSAQGCPHYRLNEQDFAVLEKAHLTITIRECLIHILANLPYAKQDLPAFWEAYAKEILLTHQYERKIIQGNECLNQVERHVQLQQIDNNFACFKSWYDGAETISSRAEFVSLYIFLHHENDRFNSWYQLLKNLMDIDEQMCLWRFHHYMMVQRMIGHKIGTGGSSGQTYLKNHLESHRAFVFLLNLINFLLPPQQIPKV